MKDNLLPIATTARQFLERVWPHWHAKLGMSPAIPSTGTCGRSSLFLQRVLQDEHGIDAAWVTGRFISDSTNDKHSWIEAAGYIIDVTGDQFGLEPIIIVPVGDARYRAGADGALPEFRVKRERDVTSVWPDWKRTRKSA